MKTQGKLTEKLAAKLGTLPGSTGWIVARSKQLRWLLRDPSPQVVGGFVPK